MWVRGYFGDQERRKTTGTSKPSASIPGSSSTVWGGLEEVQLNKLMLVLSSLFSLMKDYFFKPPINKLSLNFLDQDLEMAYRTSYQEEVCFCWPWFLSVICLSHCLSLGFLTHFVAVVSWQGLWNVKCDLLLDIAASVKSLLSVIIELWNGLGWKGP